jgi:hypothetical protein
MTRKGRLKRPKLPVVDMSGIQNGLGNQELPDSGVSETPLLHGSAEMVETTSPPRVRSLRPSAPEVDLSPPPDNAEDFERSDESRRIGRDDDASVPPVDLDAGFFSVDVAPDEASFEVETRDPRAALKLTPAAAKRRAHLAKYVTAAVGLASALCIAALVKSSFAGSHEPTRSQHGPFAAQAAATGLSLNGAAVTESPPSPASPANSAPVDPPAKAEVASPTPEQAAPAQAASAAAPVVADAPVPAKAQAVAEPPADPKVAAAKEKAKSRGALERGNMSAAIAAGERSVALDSTDAEAWLILGAAYQQKGDAKNAVRSFRACVSQGKRGPTSDCAAMLR